MHLHITLVEIYLVMHGIERESLSLLEINFRLRASASLPERVNWKRLIIVGR